MDLKQLFLRNNAQTSDFPLLLEFEYAKGVFLFDKQGTPYLDLISGIGVSNIGHCHPKVVEAIKQQVEKYMHLMVYGEYIQAPQVQYAKKLLNVLPNSLDNIYFTNSGSESVEGALKLAKRFTQRTEIIAFRNSYHGSTHGALSVMGDELFKQNYRPLLPDVKFLEINSFDDLEQISDQTACVILETIQGEAGVIEPQKSFLNDLRAKCNQSGALLILDEIQTGFGRTGKLFAFEHFDIVPDVLVIAKGMGGGMPIGAFVASRQIMGSLKENPVLGHITTFGGHPVNCAAAMATLEVLLEEDVVSSVIQKGEIFKSLLVHPKIKGIRGKGLMLSVVFDSFEFNKQVIDHCIENQVIVDWFLHCSHAMRIAPPLIITEEEIKDSCKIILNAIDSVN